MERPKRRWRWGVAWGAALYILCSASAASAAVPIAEWNEGDGLAELSGYVRSVSGVHDLGYGEPLLEEETGLQTAVGRLQWRAAFGQELELKFHQELLWSVVSGGQSSGAGGGPALVGIGASRSADPTVDLRTELVDERGFRLVHDVDRLAADIYTDFADITVGRQGITWGKSALFPVADLWGRFSPFDLDTLQKPGIDAVRVLAYPSMSTEVDLVVADRGSVEDLSAGVRAAGTVGRAELWGGAGKFWDEILGIAGASVVFDRIKLRGEIVVPWKLELDRLEGPRATAGAEWFGPQITIGGEYHFNGTGAPESAGYAEQAVSQEFRRGETYFLGRHYGGIYGSYGGVEEVEMQLSAISNLVDPSLIVGPRLQYQIAQNTTLGAGAFVSAGEEPRLAPPTALRSEFGTYGNFYFVELTAYY